MFHLPRAANLTLTCSPYFHYLLFAIHFLLSLLHALFSLLVFPALQGIKRNIFINMLYGFGSPNIDHWAHAFGFSG
jgi:hypothetical protein